MSEEEKKAIDYFKIKIKNKLPLYEETYVDGKPYRRNVLQLETNFTEEQANKTEILLNLIDKQQKEIEELKKPKYLLNVKTGEITTINNSEFISKDKIKAKIEEYKKQIEKMEKDDNGIGFTLGKEWSDLKAKVEFGQSLLEKENKK